MIIITINNNNNNNDNNSNNNIYPGSPLALAVFSGPLQIIIKLKTRKEIKKLILQYKTDYP